MLSTISGKHFETGLPTRIDFDPATGLIRDVVSVPENPDGRIWIAPALWDIQTNGRWGISFSAEDLEPEQVIRIVRAHASLGTAKLCPTLITASRESFLRGVTAIANACEAEPEIDRMVVGIHLEGPSISEKDGYRGAHPLSAVRDPDWDEYRSLQDASRGRVKMITLAPERSGSIRFIERATDDGVAVAIGHTAADLDTIRDARKAGARLSTHLGNGIVSPLQRHPNPIWHQAADDDLFASFIPDGHHLDLDTLRVLVRAKGPDLVVLVSDFSPLAGLPPGRYGEWEVDPSGKIVVAGTPYLAGSNQGLDVGLSHLLRVAAPRGTLVEAIRSVTANPARFLGLPEPRLLTGGPADVLAFTIDEDPRGYHAVRFVETIVAGKRYGPIEE